MSASMQAGMALLKDLMAVGAGSFVGGGARYLVACATRRVGLAALPAATFAVNVLGCFAIGFLASYHTESNGPAPRVRLISLRAFAEDSPLSRPL